MIRRPPRSTHCISSAASDVYKRQSKTSPVKAKADYDIPMRIGPSDYVDFIDNEKICYINIEGKYFGKIPIKLDLKLKVIEAYNSEGIMIDDIR